MDHTRVLRLAQQHATAYLSTLDTRPVGTTVTADHLRVRLGGPLPEDRTDPVDVIDNLVKNADEGLLASTGGRFFGWVIGGALPVAIAADWLTSTWDQNAAIYASSPASAIVEEITGTWLKELLGLPSQASFGFVTGCQMAHATALAAARHKLLALRGWDVESAGLCGAPAMRVLASRAVHESVNRAVRLLGMGSKSIELLPCDEQGAVQLDALSLVLQKDSDRPTVVCLLAGDLNTGAFDSFGPACDLAHSAGAWVHVDGAFGLWAAVSDRHRYLLQGVERADSWATDGHKWLNLPYDSGFVFVADPTAHSPVFSQATSYAVPVDGARGPMSWNPEWSRRGRGLAAYAAIQALGRKGIAELIDNCCAYALDLVSGIAQMPGVEVVAYPRINQGLVRFLDENGDHDRRTDEVISAIEASGEAWFGGTTWNNMRCMRISVCNWRTTPHDVERTLAAVRNALEGRPIQQSQSWHI